MDKLGMSLEDMIKAAPAKGGGRGKGKGGRGGRGEATGRGGAVRRDNGKAGRAAASPYQKPNMKQTLSSMTAPKSVVGLTTGTTLRVGNLDFQVSTGDIEVLTPFRHAHLRKHFWSAVLLSVD